MVKDQVSVVGEVVGGMSVELATEVGTISQSQLDGIIGMGFMDENQGAQLPPKLGRRQLIAFVEANPQQNTFPEMLFANSSNKVFTIDFMPKSPRINGNPAEHGIWLHQLHEGKWPLIHSSSQQNLRPVESR